MQGGGLRHPRDGKPIKRTPPPHPVLIFPALLSLLDMPMLALSGECDIQCPAGGVGGGGLTVQLRSMTRLRI
jgi:hypothetical protein